MSDEEEEEEWEAEEEENETTEESNDEGGDSDASVDEGPSVGPESNTSGSGQYRKKKEDAKRPILKRKRGKEQEKKVKRIKHDDEAGEKDPITVAAAASRVAETKKGKSVRKNDEIKAKPIEALEKQPTSSTGEKRQYPVFPEKNVDYNFVSNSTQNVVVRSCQIATNIILQCKNIEINQNGQCYDYASLTFSRKTKNGKSFEYNIPLSLAPVLIQAVEQIIKDNAKFFANLKEKEQKEQQKSQ